eukprot:scaffold3210_cov4495-Pavlova_lutheri.AAC.23
MLSNNGEYIGIGRRKSAVAKIKIIPGTGQIEINGRPGLAYLQYNPAYVSQIQGPMEVLGLSTKYDVFVNTQGGGLTGQAEAIKLGVARALCQFNIAHRAPLKVEGFLTRDARIKERKKYGLKKARKAPQFSKR